MIELKIDTTKMADRLRRAFSLIDTIVNSPEYQQLKAQSKEIAKQKRWATDPLDLMQYWNYFKLVSLRRNLANFLYELARLIDPDLVD